jgi:hypothetical protein
MARHPSPALGILRPLVATGLIIPRGTSWHQLTNHQRVGMILRGTIQFVLLAAALRDLHTRPASQIRGPKPMWLVVSAVNYLGSGPIAYFLLGRRRRAPQAIPATAFRHVRARP